MTLQRDLRLMTPRNGSEEGFRENSEAATEKIPKNFSESFSKNKLAKTSRGWKRSNSELVEMENNFGRNQRQKTVNG